ncbi:hypothetical protein ACFXN1_38895, partial [Nocardia sp. NPDC059154]
GLAMKSGLKRPGPKAPGAAAPVDSAPAEAAPAPAAEHAAPAATESNGTPEGNGSVAPPAAKPGGLGFKSGMKAPGRKN